MSLLPAPVQTRASHYAGSAASGPAGPTTLPAPAVTSNWIVHVQWVALARAPAVPSVALGSRSNLLLADNSSTPLLGSPQLTAGVRLVEAPAAVDLQQAAFDAGPTEAARLGQFTSALPANVTGVFEARVPSGSTTVPDETLQLRISTGSVAPTADATFHDALTVTLTPSGSTPSTAGPPQTETAFFDQTASQSHDAFALLVRPPSSGPRGLVLAAVVDVRPATASAADAAALAQCNADLQQSANLLSRQFTRFPLGISVPAGIVSALDGLDDPGQLRSSLTYLADQGDASLALDVALVADPATLADLAHRVRQATRGQLGADFTAAALGWTLDHAAFDLLTALADSPEGAKLSPELASVLTLYCGEPARHTAALDELAHGLGSEADLHNRLIAQNLLFLSDPSPAARVRAFDWLNSRRLAPAGFDPLGTARERRQAMDRATPQ